VGTLSRKNPVTRGKRGGGTSNEPRNHPSRVADVLYFGNEEKKEKLKTGRGKQAVTEGKYRR